jgi:hypothetical protein
MKVFRSSGLTLLSSLESDEAASGKSSSHTPLRTLNPMKQIRLKISDLFAIDPQTAERPKEFAAITEYVLKEAARLAERAVKRASEGQYEKAIGIELAQYFCDGMFGDYVLVAKLL